MAQKATIRQPRVTGRETRTTFLRVNFFGYCISGRPVMAFTPISPRNSERGGLCLSLPPVPQL